MLFFLPTFRRAFVYRSNNTPFFVVMSVCCLLIAAFPASARNLSVSGDWEYSDSRDETDEFSQNYTVDFDHRIFLTPAMNVEAAVRYNHRKDRDSTTRNVTPSLTYILQNDIFYLNLAGHANEQFNSDRNNYSNRSFDANWNSNWQAAGWVPALTANYNRNWSKDDDSPKNTDSDGTNTGFSLDWDDLPVKGFYSYNWLEDNNDVTSARFRSYNHLGRLSTDSSFWRDKGYISLSQQYSFTKNENRVKNDGTGTALVKVNMTAYAAEADPAISITLPANGALTNGDKTDVAVSVNDPPDPDRMMIGIRPNFRTVHTLYLFTVDSLSAAVSSQFTWDLYYSNDNYNWTLARSSVPASYDSTARRFEIDISGFDRDFLRIVAVDDPSADQVDFAEVEVYRKEAATGDYITVKDDQTVWSSDVDISLDIQPTLTLTANFSYEQNDYSNSPDLRTTKVNSALRWEMADSVFADLTGSYTLRDREDSANEEYRTYGLSLTVPLLPSVHTVGGATLSEDYEDSTKMTTTWNYDLQVVADLYSDLDSRFNLSYDQSTDEIDDETISSTRADIRLTARLVPGLVANYSADYNKTSGQSEIIDMDLDFNWRTSEVLVLRSAIRQTWQSGEDKTLLSCGFDFALTRKMEIAFNAGYEINPDNRYVTAVDWRWTMSDNLSLVTTGSYEDGDDQDEEWTILSRLNARFADL